MNRGPSKAAGDKPDERGRGVGGAAPLGAAMREYLKASGLASQLRNATVYSTFVRSLPEHCRARVRPVRFAAGALFVEVDSAAHLSELQGFEGEAARERTNEILGEQRIRRVVFRTGS